MKKFIKKYSCMENLSAFHSFFLLWQQTTRHYQHPSLLFNKREKRWKIWAVFLREWKSLFSLLVFFFLFDSSRLFWNERRERKRKNDDYGRWFWMQILFAVHPQEVMLRSPTSLRGWISQLLSLRWNNIAVIMLGKHGKDYMLLHGKKKGKFKRWRQLFRQFTLKVVEKN